jgi:hypothetical protein
MQFRVRKPDLTRPDATSTPSSLKRPMKILWLGAANHQQAASHRLRPQTLCSDNKSSASNEPSASGELFTRAANYSLEPQTISSDKQIIGSNTKPSARRQTVAEQHIIGLSRLLASRIEPSARRIRERYVGKRPARGVDERERGRTREVTHKERRGASTHVGCS